MLELYNAKSFRMYKEYKEDEAYQVSYTDMEGNYKKFEVVAENDTELIDKLIQRKE